MLRKKMHKAMSWIFYFRHGKLDKVQKLNNSERHCKLPPSNNARDVTYQEWGSKFPNNFLIFVTDMNCLLCSMN